jgi:hypothetical protein
MLSPLNSFGRLALAFVLLAACETGTSQSGSSWESRGRTAVQGKRGDFTRDFRIEDCTFQTTGNSPFFPLVIGQVSEFRGEADSEREALTITTTDATIDVGGITARIIEERHTVDGELVEVSRNYFAHCAENNTVFYFGEDVDNYEAGQIANHDGSWRHGRAGATAGVIVPGLPLLGARYFQEIAPGTALDRAEVMQLNTRARTPYGTFDGVLVTEETTPLEPDARETKMYAPGVGLIVDAELRLTTVVIP